MADESAPQGEEAAGLEGNGEEAGGHLCQARGCTRLATCGQTTQTFRIGAGTWAAVQRTRRPGVDDLCGRTGALEDIEAAELKEKRSGRRPPGVEETLEGSCRPRIGARNLDFFGGADELKNRAGLGNHQARSILRAGRFGQARKCGTGRDGACPSSCQAGGGGGGKPLQVREKSKAKADHRKGFFGGSNCGPQPEAEAIWIRGDELEEEDKRKEEGKEKEKETKKSQATQAGRRGRAALR